jgi:predicted DNA-binding ribbon-helix-helix protein
LPGRESKPPVDQAVRKRSVTIAGHKTSLSLEAAFWHALKAFAAADGVSLNALIERIDKTRRGNLSSAVRVYILERTRRTD